MSDEKTPRAPDPEVMAAADEFAAQALKSALKPAPDGLNVLEELAKAVPKSRPPDKTGSTPG